VGSPITLSGFNNIDFGSIVTSLMQQASLPLTALQNQQAALTSRSATIDKLGANLDALNTAAEALSNPDSLNAFQATSSDTTAVSASIGSGAVAGHYEVVVSDLARAQVTASGTAPDATTTAVTTGGTLTIGGVDVQVSGAVTMQQLAAAINATAGIGATASVVRSGANAYRLVLTGHTSGADAGFTIVNGLSGGSGVTFTDTDQNGVSGDSPEDNALSASDAQVLVNNVAVQSTSNTLTDVIPGVTLNLTKKDATVSIDVASDDAALGAQVTSFIQAYNTLVQFANSQATAAANGDASSIGRDPLLRGLRNRLRSAIGAAYSGGAFSRLSEVGVEFTQTGTLQLNQSVFAAAVSGHPDDLKQLFTGAGGAFPAVTGMLDEYSQAGGFLATFKTQLTQQSSALDRQISAMQDRLAIQKTALQKEFSAADDLISQLQSQSSALTNFANSLSKSS
jgi:flagellar hook-associated protein 2